MVQLAHDGLELWYGTPDAPAPDGTTEQRQGVSVTVGVRPANPSNAVSVRYRVDGRGVETVSAPLVANDFQKRTQYFRATFPTFWSGETVEYVPVVSCEGRRAPDPATASTFPSSFLLGEASAAYRRAGLLRVRRAASHGCAGQPRAPSPCQGLSSRESRSSSARHRPALSSTGFPLSGTLDGPAFHATVIPGGEHQTIVRTDGIGILSASVSLETHDPWPDRAALLRHGRFRRGLEPWELPLRKVARFAAGALANSPADRRSRSIGGSTASIASSVGQVRLPECSYTYDMYAVR